MTLNNVVTGSCLCGEISFEVAAAFKVLYFCHCSKCRKFTGSGNASLLAVKAGNLTWKQGAEYLHEFTAPSGYHAVSCSQCGSPMPKLRYDKIYLIPAGSLDGEPEVVRPMHIYCDSRAPWQEISDSFEQFPEGPPR